MAAVSELSTAVGTRAACRALFAPRASHYRQRRAAALPCEDQAAVRAATRSCVRRNAKPSWRICTAKDSRIARPPLFMRRCSMKGSITARSAPCTACWSKKANPRTPRPTCSSALPEAGTAGHRAQSALELGHHQAAGAGQVDLLLSLRDPRCLQPLRHRLDGGHARKRGTGQAADRGELRETKHPAGQLTLHADRGTSMSSKPVAFLLADLGVTKTHSRPHVSDDNPYSESQFRTLKYRPEFPDRFGCIQDSRAFSQGFFRWYNQEHRHSGAGLAHPGHGPLQPNCAHPRTAPSRSRCRLSRPSRTLRPPGPQTNYGSHRGLDQQTAQLK